ncbi:MAG TPA: hypothetical protein VLA82_02275 [Actinomycetota bacterium]|nr:hypothetical protein [Actinomycetota bacterium]
MWTKISLAALVVVLGVGLAFVTGPDRGANGVEPIALADDDELARREDEVARDADDDGDEDGDDTRTGRSRKGGDGDKTRGDDGTSGGRGGDGDRTAGNDGTSGGWSRQVSVNSGGGGNWSPASNTGGGGGNWSPASNTGGGGGGGGDSNSGGGGGSNT